MASREQASPGDQPRRPARATGLPSRRIGRRQAPSQRWLWGGRRTRQLVAAAFVVVVGVGVLWRARAAIDAASARPPDIVVALPRPTDNTAEMAAPTAIATDTPTSLPPTLSPTATTVVVSTQAPAATSTPDAGASVAVAQASPTSAAPEATTTPVPVAAVAATAEPEPTAMAEEAPAQAEPPTPTPAPVQPARAYRTYVVQRGDILKQIAASYGVSMASIMAINSIPNPDSLQVGQVLRIPPAGS
jgi:LysM repeat protein